VSIHLHWFLPTYGDSRDLIAGGHGSNMHGDRPADLRYLIQLAQAAEINGFEAVLTPTGLWCEDAWLTTATLINSTESLKYLVAFRPGLISPTLAAQMASTFQWHSQGRLLLNVVTGGESIEQRAFGDFLEKRDRYARCGEFLDIVRRLWTSDDPVTVAGEHLRVEQASLGRRPDPLPAVFFGGSSPEAGQVAARYADTYLTWGEPPAQVSEKLNWIRGLAKARGRKLSYGIRLHVISRDTSEQAWSEAQRLLGALSPETVAAAQQSLARRSPKGNVECVNCTAAVMISRKGWTPDGWRSTQTCGPASAWSAAAQAPPWSVRMRRSPTGSASTRSWVWTTSSCPATRTSRRPTSSGRGFARSWPCRVCWARMPGWPGRPGRPVLRSFRASETSVLPSSVTSRTDDQTGVTVPAEPALSQPVPRFDGSATPDRATQAAGDRECGHQQPTCLWRLRTRSSCQQLRPATSTHPGSASGHPLWCTALAVGRTHGPTLHTSAGSNSYV
jgi:alkanesulfonate monooxygenase SsuD/methylene tetrahydromethanopterin reductase-like flavin-dependent oxidoreductase (luciferase family)